MTPRSILCLASIVFVYVFLVSAPGLRAEETSEKSSRQFSCLTLQALPYPELYYRDGSDLSPLELFVNFRSALHPLGAGMEKLELFIQHIDSEGNAELELVGEAKLVPKTKRMLFVVQMAEKGSKLPLQIFGLDDSLKEFPKGSFRFLNFTTVPLTVTFNGSKSALKPNSLKLIPSKVMEGGGFLPVTIESQGGENLFETRLYSQASGREMIFIGPPSVNKDRLTIKFLTEVFPPPITEERN